MSQAGVDYSALAAQAGAISSMPAPARPPVRPSGNGPVDYRALALQSGALDTGMATPVNSGAVAEGMAKEGVTDYQPGQGLPFPRMGGIRSGDITPSQAAGGAMAIGGAATAGLASPAMLGNLGKIVQVMRALGYTTFGLEGAHKLYTTLFGEGK